MLAFAVNSSGVATPSNDGNILTQWQECWPGLDKSVLGAIRAGSVNKDPKFLSLVAAVVAAESGGAPTVVSPSGAVGLMQVMPIAADEAEIQCPDLVAAARRVGNTHRKRLLDPTTNVGYGSCVLQHYLRVVDGNIFLALVMYNGGYKQLTRLETNGTLAKETMEYVQRVHQYLRRCQ